MVKTSLLEVEIIFYLRQNDFEDESIIKFQSIASVP